jgi:hypothetical protein
MTEKQREAPSAGNTEGGGANTGAGGAVVLRLNDTIGQGKAQALETALGYAEAGLCVLSVQLDGSKEPNPKVWKAYQTRKPTARELARWFTRGEGFGLVCGAISGNLEVIDFDDLSLFDPWAALVEKEAPGLLARLPLDDHGHVFYRCAEIDGNAKLAKSADGAKTLIETRGEGGFIICPPTAARYHPRGRGYAMLRGDLRAIPTITPDERTTLLYLATNFNQYHPVIRETAHAQGANAGDRPGDRWAATQTWADILEPHGWEAKRQSGDKIYWRRPGKDTPGCSATTNYGGYDTFHVFSSNAAPFDSEKGYTKFTAYVMLNHDSDWIAATRAVVALGFGDTGAAQGSGQGGGKVVQSIITNNRQLPDISRDALGALVASNDPPRLFVRGGALVRVEHDEEGRPVIRALTLDALTGELARAARFVKVDDRGERNVTPPATVARDLAALPGWPCPPLLGIIEAPTLRPDGSILATPGYDAATRLYHDPTPGLDMPDIPANPTPADVGAAIETLHDLICDFPFTDAASLAHAYALLLTPLLRPFIRGHAPLLLVDKPQAGTGASLLTELAAMLATGRPAAMMTAPGDDDEMRKKITAALLAGATLISIDNIEGRLASAPLAMAVTAPVWQDRILGAHEQTHLTVRVTWTLTGNNVALGGDLPRRTVWIRLDAADARPWQRKDFRHPELIAYAERNRGRIIAAALTLAQSWIRAGMPGPEPGCAPLGSFEHWRHTVGGILHHAGVTGFLGNLEAMYEQADSDGPAWVAFCGAWHEAYSDKAKTTRELAADLIPDKDGKVSQPALLDALPAYIGAPSDRGFTRALGAQLAKIAGVHHPGGWVLRKAGEARHAVKWQLIEAGSGFVRLDARGRPVKGELCESGELFPQPDEKNKSPERSGNDSRNSPNSHSAPVFTPSADWQEIPDGCAVPPGGEYRLDMATGRNYARWPSMAGSAAEAWLRATLASMAPMPSAQVRELATGAGIGEGELSAAMAALSIDPTSLWMVPL